MRLDLSHIRQPETAFLRQYEPYAFAEDDEDYRVVAPVSLGFTIHKDKDRFQLVGTVGTTLDLRYSRCLEPFALPLDAIGVSAVRRSPALAVSVAGTCAASESGGAACVE